MLYHFFKLFNIFTFFFQSEIAKLEQVKESMTRELVLLTEQNEDYQTKISRLESLEKDYKASAFMFNIVYFFMINSSWHSFS